MLVRLPIDEVFTIEPPRPRLTAISSSKDAADRLWMGWAGPLTPALLKASSRRS